jgi:hypothetical protein
LTKIEEQILAAKAVNLWDDISAHVKAELSREDHGRFMALFGEAYMGLSRNIFDLARAARGEE